MDADHTTKFKDLDDDCNQENIINQSLQIFNLFSINNLDIFLSISWDIVILFLLLLFCCWRGWKEYSHSQLIHKIHQIIQLRRLTALNIQNKLILPKFSHEKILFMNILELSTAMNNYEFTSYELVSLYIHRCIEIGRKYQAITEEFYEEALIAAKESDDRRSHGKCKGILDGIPFSVKDCFDQKGADSSCGLATLVGKVKQHDCPLIEILRNAGAIPFVRSNVPPILMAWETVNHAYGATSNPWNKLRITGGSSGGEAALISSCCSPIGIGTDIGGSLRIPAACCGIYSLKPTTRRLSTKLVSCQEVPGQIAILSSPGPMGRCVADLEVLMRVWLNPKHPTPTTNVNDSSSLLNHDTMPKLWSYDPYTPPTLWRNQISDSPPVTTRPLRIGYITTNSFFDPATCCLRALNQAIETLKSEGHELSEWKPPLLSFSKAGFLANQVFVADRCDWLRSILGDERPHHTVLGGVILGMLPTFLLSLLSRLLKVIPYTRRLGILLEHTFAKSYHRVSDMWKLHEEIQTYRNQFYEQYKLSKYDLLLCPTMGLPAIIHHDSVNLLPVVMYTSIFNVLEYPAGHVPITHVRPEECSYTDSWNDLITKLAHEQMIKSIGLPVGISVIGLPYDDESVINVMKILEKKYPFQSPTPLN